MAQPAMKETGLLATLNDRLVKHVKAQAAATKQVTQAPEPVEQPSVLRLLDEAIAALPATETGWHVAQRYPSGDFKQRCFRARETMCTLRNLLADDE